MKLPKLLPVLSLAWLVCAGSLFAHDPGLSSTDVEIQPHQIVATVMLNPRDAGLAGVAATTGTEAVRENFITLSLDGRPLAPAAIAVPQADHNNNIVYRFTYPRPVATGTLVFQSLVLARLPFGHREFLKIFDPEGTVFVEALLHQSSDSGQTFLVAASAHPASAAPSTPAREPPTFFSFLSLGIEHILTGYDHLLFLTGLLLVCASFRQAAAIITCFTVAHSITLALATLNIVTLSSRIVEPAIAASIAYVGIENFLRQGTIQWRWALTFGFGLIHGLGFASVLRDMNITAGGHGIVIPLISFNLGVELGQLSVAALVLPLIFTLRQHPLFLRLGIPAGSIVIALLGAFWFLQRTCWS